MRSSATTLPRVGCGVSTWFRSPMRKGDWASLSFESSDPDFLSEVHFEMIKVIASQATVALRNASLYQEVPFIGVLEPLIQKKNKFKALPAIGARRHSGAGCCGSRSFWRPCQFPCGWMEPRWLRQRHAHRWSRRSMASCARFMCVKASTSTRGDCSWRISTTGTIARRLSAAQAKYQSAMSEANRALASERWRAGRHTAGSGAVLGQRSAAYGRGAGKNTSAGANRGLGHDAARRRHGRTQAFRR